MMTNQQRTTAFLWSTGTVAAVTIQKHWKRYRAEKQFSIMWRRSQLAKRAQSIKRQMERKWRWTDAIKNVMDKPLQVGSSVCPLQASLTGP